MAPLQGHEEGQVGSTEGGELVALAKAGGVKLTEEQLEEIAGESCHDCNKCYADCSGDIYYEL